MADTIDPTKRLWLRATLVAGILLGSIALWAVYKGSPLGRDDEEVVQDDPGPLADDAGRHVRVHGRDGQAVPRAATFVKNTGGEAPEGTEWHPEVGVLVLPESGVDYRVRVMAPGMRLRDLPAIRGGQSIMLTRGLVSTVTLRGIPEGGLPKDIRFLLRMKPIKVEADGLKKELCVELMDNLGGPGSGPDHIPRGDFGYPLSRVQAVSGIVLPAPGTYHVHWGLINTAEGTWFTLGDRCGRSLTIDDIEAVQPFVIDVTLEDLQATVDGLAARLKEAKEQR